MSIAVILGVTGASGAAIARATARAPGLDVHGFHRGRHPEVAAALRRDIEALGRTAALVERDAGTVESATAGAEELLARYGPRSVKLFVHAIASSSLGPLARGDGRRMTPDRVHRSFESMAHSFLWWVQALYDRDILAPSARLLALGNTTGEALLRQTAVIAASKAALTTYVRYLAWELGPLGHRVNLLKFGALRSPATEATFAGPGMGHVEAVISGASPSGRTITAEEVGAFVSVLASAEGAWFNGAVIDFTGGEVLPFFDALVYGPGGPHGQEE